MTKKRAKKVEAKPMSYDEYEMDRARRRGFQDGWEAAKLDAFRYCAEEVLHGKTGDKFMVAGEVARCVLRLVKVRLQELNISNEWAVAADESCPAPE